MRYSVATLLSAAGIAQAAKQACAGVQAVTDTVGNYYCSAVDALAYQNVGRSTHGRFVSHIGDGGECSFEDTQYQGPLAPLNRGVSVHFRGPLCLKQFAVYYLGGTATKRDVESEEHAQAHARNHAKRHRHRQAGAVEETAERKGEEPVWVTAILDGHTVSWVNNYLGPATQPPSSLATPTASPSPVGELRRASITRPKWTKSQKKPKKPKTNSGAKPAPPPPGQYKRIGYYNAEQGKADGLTFMGNYGGQGSGVWSPGLGNSLSYLSADGTSAAAQPTVLNDVCLPSNKEFAVFTNLPCDETCGYYRPGTPAMQGFTGSDKVFITEFKMPVDGDRGFNGDMPAYWLLNARIPRTMQYGACSCWQDGCGECDVMEVLDKGDLRCKSTLHTNNPGGSSDYIARPTDSFVKVATIFHGATESITIKLLPSDFVIGDSLTKKDIESWIDVDQPDALMSLFQVV